MAKKVRRNLKGNKKNKKSSSKKELSALFHEWKRNISAPQETEAFFLALQQKTDADATASFTQNIAPLFALKNLRFEAVSLPTHLSGIGGLIENNADKKGFLASDEFNNRLVELKSNFEIEREIPASTALRYPRKLFRCKNGETVLIDAWNHRICMLDETLSNITSSFGQYGTEEGEFFEPSSVAEDHEGRLYISDRCNHRIQVFSCKKQLFSFGERGEFSPQKPQFEFPTAVEIIEDTLFVLDSGNNIIQACTLSGKPLFCITPPDRSFASPQSMVHYNEMFIVANMNKSALSFFSTSGFHLFHIDLPYIDNKRLYPHQLFLIADKLYISCSGSTEKILRLSLPPFHLREYVKALAASGVAQAETKPLLLIEAEGTPNKEKLEGYVQKLPLMQASAFFNALLRNSLHDALLNNLLCMNIRSLLEKTEQGLRERTAKTSTYLQQAQKLEVQILSDKNKEIETSYRLEKLHNEFGQESEKFRAPLNELHLLFDILERLDSKNQQQEEYIPSRLALLLYVVSFIHKLFDLKGKYDTQAYEEFSKEALDKSESWYILHNALFFSKEVEELLLHLYASLPATLQAFSRVLPHTQKKDEEDIKKSLQQLQLQLASLLLYEDFSQIKNEWMEISCIKMIEATILHIQRYTKGELHGSQLTDNPDILALSAYLKQSANDLPLTVSPLTRLQLLLIEKEAIGKEQLDALDLDASKERITAVTQELIAFSLETEAKITPLIQEREQLIISISAINSKMKWFKRGDMKLFLALMRELFIAHFSLHQLESQIALAATHQSIAINLLLISDYALIKHTVTENSKDEQSKILTEVNTIKENFNKQYLNTSEEEFKLQEQYAQYNQLICADTEEWREDSVQNHVENEQKIEQIRGTITCLKLLLKHCSRLYALSSSYVSSFQLMLAQKNGEELPDTLRSGEGKLHSVSSLLLQCKDLFVPFKCIWRDGEYLVCNNQARRIERYNAEGAYLGAFFEFPQSSALNAICPSTFNFTENGHLVLLDGINNILCFAHNGRLSAPLYNRKKDEATSTLHDLIPLPKSDNTVILTHSGSGTLLTFTEDEIKPKPISPDPSFFPNASLLILHHKKLGWFVTEENPVRIRRYDDNWKLLNEFQFDEEGKDLRCIAVDEYERIWCSDMHTSCLHIFDKELNYKGQYGSKGGGTGQFVFPAYITSHPDGGLMICDPTTGNITLLRFS